ncbi:MAG: exodeoxyribonuclease VII small subunit [Actinomycetia bacterium]|nr:exodeoxyribonuclease VII small subunit [Actinomycetes bacterium]
MTAQNSPTPPPGEPGLSYEAARAELMEVVAKLESGGASLAESMTLWERGEALAAMCQYWLDDAAARIEAARAVAADE